MITLSLWQRAISFRVAVEVPNLRQLGQYLFASGQPPVDALQLLRDNQKIKQIVDLQADNQTEYDEAKAAGALGMTVHSIPLPALEIVTEPPMKQMLDAHDAIRDILLDPASGSVLVHCEKGSDRTGAVIAMFRIDQGWAVEQAIAEMRQFGNSLIEQGYRSFIEAYSKLTTIATAHPHDDDQLLEVTRWIENHLSAGHRLQMDSQIVIEALDQDGDVVERKLWHPAREPMPTVNVIQNRITSHGNGPCSVSSSH